MNLGDMSYFSQEPVRHIEVTAESKPHDLFLALLIWYSKTNYYHCRACPMMVQARRACRH
jgi:hypothetical protein